ncbi:phosphatidylethanolamine-binding protein [Fennellomyces sp. T-0311]|nr:phosphatidylethanolamine-binding protein [Fennellomyces sp. T-0311]
MVKLSLTSLCAVVVAGSQLVAGALDPYIADPIKSSLRTANIIPGLLPDFEVESFLKITYGDRVIMPGEEMMPHELVDPPHIWFPAPNVEAQYTIVLFDADAHVPLVRHWIVANVEGGKPGSDIRDPLPQNNYTPYHGPTPPLNSGKHRYVFALYEQSEKNQVTVPVLEDTVHHRAYFDIEQFAKDNKLKLVGATYMMAEHEDGYEGLASMHTSVASSPTPSSM